MNILKKINRLWNKFSIKEKVLSFGFAILVVFSLVKIAQSLVNKITVLKPAIGGTLNYGTWEAPKTINPVISQNSDVEQELINMIYSGLIEEDGKGGFENNLAEEIIINSQRTVYEIYIRDDVYFHDGKKLTADDVIFTVSAMKNPEYKSPLLSLFKDVKIEKLGELMVKITVPVNQTNFYNYLGFKIMPKHLWENVDVDFFAVHELNNKPVGSGPYVISKVQKNRNGKIVNLSLKRNKKYFKEVFIEKINVQIFDSIESTFVAFVKGNIDMIKELTPYQKDLVRNKSRIKINHTVLPRYYAIFLNQKNSLLSNPKINEALDMAIDKQKIVDMIFFKDAELLNAPISSKFIGYHEDLNANIFNLEKAKAKLKALGFEDRDGNGVMEKWSGKNKTDLEFSLLLPSNNELIHLADMVKKDWESLGVKIHLQIVPLHELYKDYLKTRNYDALIFGETYTITPDLYYFWHSSQTSGLGLNLSVYKNQGVDSILEINHTTTDRKQIEKNLLEFQELLNKDRPAIFLNNPHYINAHNKRIKIEDYQIYNSFSSSFTNVDKWYIEQKRTIK